MNDPMSMDCDEAHASGNNEDLLDFATGQVLQTANARAKVPSLKEVLVANGCSESHAAHLIQDDIHAIPVQRMIQSRLIRAYVCKDCSKMHNKFGCGKIAAEEWRKTLTSIGWAATFQALETRGWRINHDATTWEPQHLIQKPPNPHKNSQDDTTDLHWSNNSRLVFMSDDGSLKEADQMTNPMSGRDMPLWTSAPSLKIKVRNLLFTTDHNGFATGTKEQRAAFAEQPQKERREEIIMRSRVRKAEKEMSRKSNERKYAELHNEVYGTNLTIADVRRQFQRKYFTMAGRVRELERRREEMLTSSLANVKL